jgi:hypothetical protein
MVSKKEKERMLEFIVGNLESSEPVKPSKKEIVPGIESSYIVVGKGGLILLVDRVYPKSAFEKLYGIARDFSRQNSEDSSANVSVVFYKDGEHFFRSAIESCDERQNSYYRKSFAHYNDDQKKKILLMSPPELLIQERKSHLQYYQPSSEMLEECIVSCRLTPAKFVREICPDHPAYGFAKPVEYSKRLSLIVGRLHTEGKFMLKTGYISGPCKKVE